MIENEYIFARALTSKAYYYFVMAQLLCICCLVVMVWNQFQKTYIIEGLLIAMMATDMFIRLMGDTTGSYTASYLNRFDLIFVVLAILIFAFETVFHPFMIAEQIDTFVFIARYISQLYRVARLVMQERDSRMVKNLEPISICFDNESFADKFH